MRNQPVKTPSAKNCLKRENSNWTITIWLFKDNSLICYQNCFIISSLIYTFPGVFWQTIVGEKRLKKFLWHEGETTSETRSWRGWKMRNINNRHNTRVNFSQGDENLGVFEEDEGGKCANSCWGWENSWFYLTDFHSWDWGIYRGLSSNLTWLFLC